MSLFAAMAMTSCSDKANDPQPKQEQVNPTAQTGELQISISQSNARLDVSDVKEFSFTVTPNAEGGVAKEYTLTKDGILTLPVGEYTLSELSFVSNATTYTQDEEQSFTINSNERTSVSVEVVPEVVEENKAGLFGVDVNINVLKAFSKDGAPKFMQFPTTYTKEGLQILKNGKSSVLKIINPGPKDATFVIRDTNDSNLVKVGAVMPKHEGYYDLSEVNPDYTLEVNGNKITLDKSESALRSEPVQSL